jgi:adenylate cyclase class 2
MAIEVELKAHLDDPRVIQVQIEALMAISAAQIISRRDTYYLSLGQHVRLREEEDKITVTTKIRHIKDGVEINDEAEFSVGADQAEALDRFFGSLGYEIDCVKTKQGLSYCYRCEEDLPPVTIEVIDVPPLGWFIEAEILLEDETESERAHTVLLSLFDQLGIDHAKIEGRPYLALLREAGSVELPQHRDSGQDSGQ